MQFAAGEFFCTETTMSPPFDPNQFVAKNVQNIPRSGIREFFELVQNQKDVISLGVGEPDFVTPWHIREAAIYALEKGKTSYTSNLGLFRLREVICTHLGKKAGVEYDPSNEILISVGVSEALDIALRALVNPGDEVLYHEPCYVSYSPSVRLAYGVSVPVPCTSESGFSVSAKSIEQAITPRSKILLLNFPTNPTGGTMTRDELTQIAEVVKKHDLLVITDEIYSELTFEGEHVSIASLPGMKDRTVFLHGFSKAYSMTGFRIGYACGPNSIIEAMMRIHQYSMLCASIISQEAAIEAILRGENDMIAMRDQYRARRNFIVNAFESMGLPCNLPRGSFYAFPSIKPTKLSSRDFAMRLLKKENIACVPGDAFGPSGEGFLRCCFATSLDQLEIAAERIARFLKTL